MEGGGVDGGGRRRGWRRLLLGPSSTPAGLRVLRRREGPGCAGQLVQRGLVERGREGVEARQEGRELGVRVRVRGRGVVGWRGRWRWMAGWGRDVDTAAHAEDEERAVGVGTLVPCEAVRVDVEAGEC